MVYRKKEYLAREQDPPTVLVRKIMTMHDHYNAPSPIFFIILNLPSF
ncbi:MAG: hypothetical protein F6K01_07165 [Okeania sp. SIO1I7]|nr:hypothetical protein [Okeania sp. SIO1I7]